MGERTETPVGEPREKAQEAPQTKKTHCSLNRHADQRLKIGRRVKHRNIVAVYTKTNPWPHSFPRILQHNQC